MGFFMISLSRCLPSLRYWRIANHIKEALPVQKSPRNTHIFLFALFGLFFASSLHAQEKKEEPAAIFKYSETFRSEVASDMERDAATPNRKESGTFRIEIVLPVSYFVPAEIDVVNDIFGVTMGNVKFEFVPNHTQDMKPRRGIRYDYSEGDGKTKPKRVYGKVRIRWTLNKVIMNIEGNLRDMSSPAGSLYIEEEAGKFTGSTLAIVRYGKRTQEFRVTIQGEIKREKREAMDGGTTTTVDVTGEGKVLEGFGQP